ncbi:MAG: TIGR01777 family oxidoreductase [Flavobacteriaceae bacterium]|nr:TIGR01777 family oxidoreductase [Flavobacteriaceae bacterium]
MHKVLITGGTGLIGQKLSSLLQSKGFEVRILSRHKKSNSQYKTFLWNVDQHSIDENAFKDLDYIIHLAGVGIADKRWSKKRKQEIIDSRVASTSLLCNTIKKLRVPIKGFISASGVGYYGASTSDTIFEENTPPANDFLGEVCRLWEESAFQFKKDAIRTVVLRTGIVLSKDGGALTKMKTPIMMPLGNGNQYMPWIHIDDLCELYSKAIEDKSLEGAYNAVAPDHQTSKSFSKAIAKTFKYPYISLAVPSFILKLVFGEMARILVYGSRISSEKIQQHGFQFKFKKLESALINLVSKH